MITSLNRIGRQLRKNEDPLDGVISIPKLSDNEKDKKNYVLNIIFDIDNQEVIISKSNLEEYSERISPKKYYHILTQRGNHKKIYITRELKNIDQLRISFFGDTKEDEAGHFLSFIDKEFSHFNNSQFYNSLNSIFSLKSEEDKIDKAYIKEKLELGRNENLVLITSSIRDSNLSITETTHLSLLDGYQEFIKEKFFESNKNAEKGFCYVSGEWTDNVYRAKFEKSVSLTKTFVSTTINYLSLFEDKNCNKNYQLSETAKFNLEAASDYIRKNFHIKIAGISHLIFPTFINNSNINITETLPKIGKVKEIAFGFREIENVIDELDYLADDEMYWFNFLAYESDGNYFKVINFIKDVPKFYFISLLQKLALTTLKFNNYFIPKYRFNLSSIYYLIPVRCNSKGDALLKHNEALLIIKDIIEKREIDFNRLVNSFVDLILIHYFKRFRQYQQFRKLNDSNFDFAVHNAVFNYSILFKTLIELDLLKGHNFTGDKMSENGNHIEKFINDFFEKMNYSEPQKAMFYLGRILDTIAYTQSKKGHTSKPILGKINFNGLDKENIQRLYEDLFEKAKQYNAIREIEFNSSLFMQHFNYNEWEKNGLSKKEALFFLLSGYSFGIALSKERKQSLLENEEIEDE